MAFRLSMSKSIQAAGVLLRQEQPPRMSRIRLLKLLYIADRESLRKSGRPITGDRVVAMRLGPVLSELYDCIKGTACRLAAWQQYFRSEGHDVCMVAPPPLDDLCPFEIKTLQEVWRDRRDRDEWEIVEETHQYSEWSDPGNSSQPIAFDKILQAVGWSEGDAGRILRDADADARVDRLFERAP